MNTSGMFAAIRQRCRGQHGICGCADPRNAAGEPEKPTACTAEIIAYCLDLHDAVDAPTLAGILGA